MNSVERVKLICKERMIPISRLERDLGYSNGYIGQLRKGVFPTDRLVEIAEYLSVSTDYLLGTSEKKAPAHSDGPAPEDAPDENYVILSRNAKKLSPEKRQQLLDMAKIMFKEEFQD